jgi:hypothetical protein
MSDIASGIEPGSSSGFMIGDVLGRTFSILGRNFVPFTVLSGIATLPQLFFLLSVPTGQAAVTVRPNPTAIFLPLVVGFVLRLLTQAVIVHAAFQDMRGRPVSVGESLRIAFSRFLPILGVIIVVGLGVFAASLALIVPGVILALMWYLALPACVVERTGVTESLGRSAELTKGHRWKLFGLILLVLIGGLIVAGVIGGVIGGVLGATGAGVSHVAVSLIQYVIQALIAVFNAILVIVLYRDLRVAKEGIGTEQIAAVFD